MKKVILTCLAAIACLLSPLSSFSDEEQQGCENRGGRDMHPGMRPGGRMDHDMKFEKIVFFKAHGILMAEEKIGLTDEQRGKIESLLVDLEKASIKNESEIKLLELDLREGIKKDEINEEAVGKLIEKKFALKEEMAKEALKSYVALNKILTKDQVKSLKTLREECMKQGMCKRCEEGMGEREKPMHGFGKHQEHQSNKE